MKLSAQKVLNLLTPRYWSKEIFKRRCSTNLAFSASMVTLLFPIITFAHPLTSTDWTAVCTSRTPESTAGCYGNVASIAFKKLNDGIGGFLQYTNITPLSMPGSVFIKRFGEGSPNTPLSTTTLSITLTGEMGTANAKCELFTPQGLGLGSGVFNNVSTSGSTTSNINGGAVILDISPQPSGDNTTLQYATSSNNTVLSPFYLLCVGYQQVDGTTTMSIEDRLAAL